MKPPITIQGRSLLFNILFSVVNIIGIFSILLGFQPAFENVQILLLIVGFLFLSASIFGIIVFKGRILMSAISRYLVGTIFIFSGLIKLNDPIGFSYKLEEYFQDGALAYRFKELFSDPTISFSFLVDYALIIGVLLCIIEIVLGVLMLIGAKIRLFSYFVLALMLFFTFLTWHTATCNSKNKYLDRNEYALNSSIAKLKIQQAQEKKGVTIVSNSGEKIIVDEWKNPQCVSDCGCFGDALKGSLGRSLTPLESLWKDILLIYFSVWIFLARNKIIQNKWKSNIWFLSGSIVSITLLSWLFDWYFPILFSILVILSGLWMLKSGGKYMSNAYGSSLLISFISLLFVWYVLAFEPMKDYRPFAIGSNLKEKMNDGFEGESINFVKYKNVKTGEVKEYDGLSNEYANSGIWEKSNWKFIGSSKKEITPSRKPSITLDFNPIINRKDVSYAERRIPFVQKVYDLKSINEISIRDFLIKEKYIFILSTRNIKEANWNKIERLKDIYKQTLKSKIPFVMFTNNGRNVINNFRKLNHFYIPTFNVDETELKIISRSSPCLLILKRGVVVEKYPFRSIPSFLKIEKSLLKI